MKTLKFCIRALKLWAKRRGGLPPFMLAAAPFMAATLTFLPASAVYKNVLGFLGGISLEIMAARVGQLCTRPLLSYALPTRSPVLTWLMLYRVQRDVRY
eukprot:1912999-Rhodomonas_salina.2